MNDDDPRIAAVAAALDPYVACDGLGCGGCGEDAVYGYLPDEGWHNYAADPAKVAAIVLQALEALG